MKRGKGPLAVGILVAATAAWLLLASVHAGAPLLTKGPYLQNPGPTAITIQYETASPGDGLVRFGAAGAMDQKAAAPLYEKVEHPENSKDKKSPMRAAYLYRARLAGLRPGTTYQYQVLPMGEGGPAAAPSTFKTFPDKADRVTFIAYGDTRTSPQSHRAVAANFNKHDPAFILHDGDLVASGDRYDLWGPEFFTPLADVIDHIPMMVAFGNHERDAKYLLQLFDLPGGRTWYSFDYGPVHVVVLDDTKTGPDVLAWLGQDLAGAKAPWKIAVYHQPSFNFEGHKSDMVRLTFLPLFQKYGVDVVVAGHSHLYERFKPLMPVAVPPGGAGAAAAAATAQALRRPITFITAGGGGAPLYGGAGLPPQPVLAKAAKAYQYCVFTVDAETLRLQALTPDGATLDTLTIGKKGGRYDDAYLAEARPMEEAILAQGVIPLAPPTVEALPTPEQPGRAVIQVRFPGMAVPVTVTVRLAEESAQAYAMDPVTAEIRPNQEGDIDVPLRALRKVAAERNEKRSVLDPEPRFVLVAKAAGLQATCETGKVAYHLGETGKSKAKAPAAKAAAKP